jgi:hypothetical protein
VAEGGADAGAAQLLDDCFGPESVTGGVGVEAILGVQPLPILAEGRACLSGDVDVDSANVPGDAADLAVQERAASSSLQSLTATRRSSR